MPLQRTSSRCADVSRGRIAASQKGGACQKSGHGSKSKGKSGFSLSSLFGSHGKGKGKGDAFVADDVKTSGIANGGVEVPEAPFPSI